MISSKASTRAPASSPISTWSTTIRRSYLRVRRAAAPVGARRLADRALAVAHGSGRRRPDRRQHAAGHLALEDPRQPPAQPDSAVARAAPRARLVGAAGIARALDHPRPARARVPRLHPVRALARQPLARRAAARTSARRRRHDRDQPAAGGLLDRHPRPSKRGDARCDRARARAAAGDAAPAARVGDGRPRRERARRRVARRAAHVAGAGGRTGDRRAGRARRARTPAAREPDPHPVVHLTGARLRHGAAAGASRHRARARTSGRSTARSRAAPGGSSRT